MLTKPDRADQPTVGPHDIDAFCEDPLAMGRLTPDQIFSLPRDQIDRFQLAGLRKRFAELLPEVPALRKLAEENRITSLDAIDAVVPLLFPHTLYKSYPVSLIDNCRFEALNTWLDGFTSYDLSGLDVSACQSLDEWLSVVEANTPLRVLTSSGTTGKISILPRSTVEEKNIPAIFNAAYRPFRDEPGLPEPFASHVYHLSPQIRHGRHISPRLIQNITEYGFNGDESHMFSRQGEMSTDMLWMTGRMRKAEADGTVEKLKKTQAWKSLSTKFDALEAKKGEPFEDFYRKLLTRFQNKTVILRCGLNFLLAMVETAEKFNLEVEFAPDSFVTAAGGLKGTTPLSDAQLAKVKKAIPFELNEQYASSELNSGIARKCRQGHYHAPHWLVSFILDPDTGAPYARHGVQTGRFAAFDLWAITYWGGFVTGDEVTMHWDGGCGCGRLGPYLEGNIARYSEKRGGDDKITCQRTAAAVAEMMEHMKSQRN